MTELSGRFVDAVDWALELHTGQVRKATGVPYAAHLLGVASLVIDNGGDEDEAVAAVLHDAIEDTHATREEIEERFGPRVAEIVEQCSDAEGRPKPPWRDRKQGHLAHLADPVVTPSALLIVAADKLHNARSLLADHRVQGAGLWRHFNAGPADQLWYYRSISEVLSARLGSPICDQLSTTVDELAAVVAADG